MQSTPPRWAEASPKAIAIGLGGVNSWVDLRNGNSQPLPELADLELKGRHVVLLFDSGQSTKQSVRAALESFSDSLHQRGATTLIIRLPSELNGAKNGADDFIHRHGPEAFHRLVSCAQPACLVKGKGGKAEWSFNLPIDPPKPQHKALRAWAVLKDHLAIRPGRGLYSWAGTCYEIPAMSSFDLAIHLGLKDSQPNTAKPAAAQFVSGNGGEDGGFSSKSFINQEKEEKNPMERVLPKNPPPSPPRPLLPPRWPSAAAGTPA